MTDDQHTPAQGEPRQQQITTDGGDYAEGNIDKRGGAFVADSTIHGDVIGQQTTIVSPDLSPHDRENRRRMLKQVRTFWVEGVLEQSLYQQVLIDLGLYSNPQAVSFAGPLLVAQGDREPEPLPAGTTMAQAFAQANQRLLILGAPGGGKTTLLLELARTLLDQAARDERRPLPVVFNLSSWAQQRLPLERWLVQELWVQYGVSRKLAQQWRQDNRILPLLDGLDEVAEPQRAACVAAINTFCQEHGSEGIAVCSRLADYRGIGAQLTLDAAVVVQPLNDAQIDSYLDRAGTPLAGVQTVLAQDADLRTLVCIPLLLNIVALAYQDQRPDDLMGLQPETQRQRLFDHYVQRMFKRRGRHDSQPYSQAQTLRWLRWLAKRLTQNNQIVFQIELMQPWWLHRWWQRGLYVLFSTIGATAGGAILGVVFGLLFGILFGLGIEALIWLIPGGITITADLSQPGDGLVFVLSDVWIFGLESGLVFGLVAGPLISLFQYLPASRRDWFADGGGLLAGGLIFLYWGVLRLGWVSQIWWWGLCSVAFVYATVGLGRGGDIRLTEGLRWSWRTLRQRWYMGLSIGLAGFAIGLVADLWIGLIIGVVGGLFIGLVTGFTQTELQTRTRPNQGIWCSLWNALRSWFDTGFVIGLGSAFIFWLSTAWIFAFASGIASGLGVGLVIGLGIGLAIGLAAGLYFGGLAFVQHFALRLVCALCGHAPWNYPRFLDYCVDRILLRRVGGSYIFVHRMLLEYFAENDPVASHHGDTKSTD